jgi:hypothetical protein
VRGKLAGIPVSVPPEKSLRDLSTQVSGSVHVNYRHFLNSPRFRPQSGGLPS